MKKFLVFFVIISFCQIMQSADAFPVQNSFASPVARAMCAQTLRQQGVTYTDLEHLTPDELMSLRSKTIRTHTTALDRSDKDLKHHYYANRDIQISGKAVHPTTQELQSFKQRCSSAGYLFSKEWQAPHKLATNTYLLDGQEVPITAERRSDSITLINHARSLAAEPTQTHLNWGVSDEQFNDPFHPAAVTLHPTHLHCAFTQSDGRIVFINFEKNEFKYDIKPYFHRVKCNQGFGPQIFFGPKDTFATEFHGEVALYNTEHPLGILTTRPFMPFNSPLEHVADADELDRELHRSHPETCRVKFNPNAQKEQLLVHHDTNLLLFSSRTGTQSKKITHTTPGLSDFTSDGQFMLYCDDDGHRITAINCATLLPHRRVKTSIPINQLQCCPYDPTLCAVIAGTTLRTYKNMEKVFFTSGNFSDLQWAPGHTHEPTFSVIQGTNLVHISPLQESETSLHLQRDHGAHTIHQTTFFRLLLDALKRQRSLSLVWPYNEERNVFDSFPREVKDELLALGTIILIDDPLYSSSFTPIASSPEQDAPVVNPGLAYATEIATAQPDLRPQNIDEPSYGQSPPPTYEEIYGLPHQPEPTTQTHNDEPETQIDQVTSANQDDRPINTLTRRPSRLQRFFAALGLRRRLHNDR